MASLLRPTPTPLLSSSKPCSFPAKITQLPTPINKRIHLSKFGNFLDLEPKSKSEPLDFDIPWYAPSDGKKFDVVVIGAGPAGLRLAEQVSGYGIKVCCLDPEPLASWPNNYGVWVDEFESLELDDCLTKTWPETCVYFDDRKIKYLGRAYGRVGRRELKSKLLTNCLTNGVRFHQTRVGRVEHEEFESAVGCTDGTELKASLVVDASGFGSSFVSYDRRRNPGYQIAHGVLAEVDDHPFDLEKMVLMDWRDSHLGNEPYLRAENSRFPTFLYVMPFDRNLVFLEETSLVGRPALPYAEVKRRMEARLRYLGIRVRSVLEDEKCVIPMGGPLPRIPQDVMAIGGNAGIVHPATGYTVAQIMAVTPVVAAVIDECLGSTRMIRGVQLHRRVWDALWPLERRRIREFYNFGMETLLQLDLDGTRRFFDAFFELDPHYWHGFLSSRLSLGELLTLGLALFRRSSNSSKLDMLMKCPVPMARMMGNMAVEAA